MKKTLLVLLAALSRCSRPPAMAQKVKVGVSIPSADHGWTGGLVYYAQMAIKDIGAKDKNVTFTLTLADSPQKQVSDVEDLMVKGVDAIVVLAYDSATVTPRHQEGQGEGDLRRVRRPRPHRPRPGRLHRRRQSRPGQGLRRVHGQGHGRQGQDGHPRGHPLRDQLRARGHLQGRHEGQVPRHRDPRLPARQLGHPEGPRGHADLPAEVQADRRGLGPGRRRPHRRPPGLQGVPAARISSSWSAAPAPRR